MNTTQESFARVQEHCDRLNAGDGTVQPGQPLNMSAALTADESIAQGDLYLQLLERVPPSYVPAPADFNGNLAPHSDVGHCLSTLNGVDVFLPPTWGQDDNLDGPVVQTHETPVSVVHGRETHGHGTVHLPANCIISSYYQREFDAEQKRERRVQD